MTPERAASLVERWVRLYTRDLPPSVARRRAAEIEADLHDHIENERARGAGDRRIALAIASRMVRGVPADASWRLAKGAMKMNKSVVRVGAVTAFVLLLNLVGMQFVEGWDWGVGDFVIAAVLLVGTGALLELAVRHPGNVVLRVAAAAIGVAAIVLGEADDAPGLVGFGCLLILGAAALTLRARAA